MLDDVLADFRERHREAHGDLGIEIQILDESLLRTLLNLIHHEVNVIAFGDRSHFKKHACLRRLRALHPTLQLVELGSMLEEIHPRPVAADVFRLRHVENGPLDPGLRQSQ